MKIIISRKGFDSGYGGVPSPILPDGTLLPLPIPQSQDAHTFADLDIPEGLDIDKLLIDLTHGQFNSSSRVHLDPDLSSRRSQATKGWRPALGQSGAAQSHLRLQKIGSGDVFLFFGWFRQTEVVSGKWQYVRGAPHLHVLFGWLEIDEVLPIVIDRQSCLDSHPWIESHAHVANPGHYTDRKNTLYVGSRASKYTAAKRPGGGLFRKISESLILTKKGETRSVWSLPTWFMPSGGRPPLSYHSTISRWTYDYEMVTLRSVAKGQEFVLDVDHYPEALQWLSDIISRNQ